MAIVADLNLFNTLTRQLITKGFRAYFNKMLQNTATDSKFIHMYILNVKITFKHILKQ